MVSSTVCVRCRGVGTIFPFSGSSYTVCVHCEGSGSGPIKRRDYYAFANLRPPSDLTPKALLHLVISLCNSISYWESKGAKTLVKLMKKQRKVYLERLKHEGVSLSSEEIQSLTNLMSD